MDITKIATDLEPAIRRAADFMRQEQRSFSMEKVEFKGRSDMVSYVDKTVEEMLVRDCKALIPGSGFILEEGDDVNTQAEFRWIIDPLDGTTNYTHGLPCYCISLALQQAGETVLGVVFDVPHDEYFLAIKGKGATLNRSPIRVSAAPDLQRSVIATGFPYTIFDRFDDYLSVTRKFMESTLGIRRFGAAAIDLAWTACGRFDGYYEMHLHPWDVAAGALLVTEAGGQVTDFQGTDNFVFGRQLASSNHVIHSGMLGVIQEFF